MKRPVLLSTIAVLCVILISGCKTNGTRTKLEDLSVLHPDGSLNDVADDENKKAAPKDENMQSSMPRHNSIYKIAVNGVAVGTGFSISHSNSRLSNYAVIITAAHSLAEVGYDASSTISVISGNGHVIKVSRNYSDRLSDFAVLVVKEETSTIQVGGMPPSEAECKSYGFSYLPLLTSNPMLAAKGFIEGVTGDDIWAYLMPFQKGGSGSPLLCNGKVVGLINSNVLNNDKQHSGVVHAIAIGKILSFVNAIK